MAETATTALARFLLRSSAMVCRPSGLVALVLALGCSPTDIIAVGDPGYPKTDPKVVGQGSSDDDKRPMSGLKPSAPDSGTADSLPPTSDTVCEEFRLPVSGLPQASDVLIVLDRSSSMAFPLASGGSKWAEVTSVVSTTVNRVHDPIHWGLAFYPTDEKCGTSAAIAVPVAREAQSSIDAAMSQRSPGGATPTREAIYAAGTHLMQLSKARAKYILLATDGVPNCAPCTPTSCAYEVDFDEIGAVAAVNEMAALGIHTFVVGVAVDSFGSTVLNQMAEAGGEARAGATKYYSISSRADLASAVDKITKQILSCTFSLPKVPTDLDGLRVVADGQVLRRDPSHASGWDYGAKNASIALYGSPCDRLQQGTPVDVRVTYACPVIGSGAPKVDGTIY